MENKTRPVSMDERVHRRSVNFIQWTIRCFLIAAALGVSRATPSFAVAPAADTFAYPIDRPLRTLLKDYDVMNPDLKGRSQCFDAAMTQLWHAGEDWFAAANTPVKAVANGQVAFVDSRANYPGAVVIIEHTVASGPPVFSMYGHLDPKGLAVGTGVSVVKGQTIATGLEGRAGNTHLHWEIRFFLDGSGILRAPRYDSPCRSGVPGPGYTHPGHPDNFVANGGAGPTYSWTSPSAYVANHLGVVITQPFAQPTQQRGETFLNKQVQLTYSAGQVILSGAGGPTTSFSVDDAMELTVTRPDGTSISRTYVFQVGCTSITSRPAENVSNLFQPGINTVNARLYDICGVSSGTGSGLLLTNTQP